MHCLVEEAGDRLSRERDAHSGEDCGVLGPALSPGVLDCRAASDQVSCGFLPGRAERADPKQPGQGQSAKEWPQVRAELALTEVQLPG